MRESTENGKFGIDAPYASVPMGRFVLKPSAMGRVSVPGCAVCSLTYKLRRS